MRRLEAPPDGPLARSIEAVEAATNWLLQNWPADPARAAAGASPYLDLFATVTGGWLMAKAARIAAAKLRDGDGDSHFLAGKLASARFYADHVLPQAGGLLSSVMNGASVSEFDPDLL